MLLLLRLDTQLTVCFLLTWFLRQICFVSILLEAFCTVRGGQFGFQELLEPCLLYLRSAGGHRLGLCKFYWFSLFGCRIGSSQPSSENTLCWSHLAECLFLYWGISKCQSIGSRILIQRCLVLIARCSPLSCSRQPLQPVTECLLQSDRECSWNSRRYYLLKHWTALASCLWLP